MVDRASYTGDVEFDETIKWKCKDRRFLIKKTGSTDDPEPFIESKCTWYNNYTLLASELGTLLHTFEENHLTLSKLLTQV